MMSPCNMLASKQVENESSERKLSCHLERFPCFYWCLCGNEVVNVPQWKEWECPYMAFNAPHYPKHGFLLKWFPTRQNKRCSMFYLGDQTGNEAWRGSKKDGVIMGLVPLKRIISGRQKHRKHNLACEIMLSSSLKASQNYTLAQRA